MKKLICAGALLAALLCAPVRAAPDPLYVGEVDAQTGEAVADAAPVDAERVWLPGGAYYERMTGSFVYPVDGGVREVRANVVDGMLVSGPVSVTASDGVELTVTRGGSPDPLPDTESISAPGAYAVSVTGTDGAMTLFTFTVVGEATNLSGGYAMPDGFYILDATLGGEDTVYDRNYIGMEDEGLYELEYVCADTGVHYRLSVTVDRTPPLVTLEGERDKNGRFHSAVQIGLEPGCAVNLTRDGESLAFPRDGRLTEAGMYSLEVFDAAGNQAAEQFTILVYLDLNGLLFFALVCLTLAGVLGYILYQRMKFKAA